MYLGDPMNPQPCNQIPNICLPRDLSMLLMFPVLPETSS